MNPVRYIDRKYVDPCPGGGGGGEGRCLKECADLRCAVYICNTNNFFPKYLFPDFRVRK